MTVPIWYVLRCVILDTVRITFQGEHTNEGFHSSGRSTGCGVFEYGNVRSGFTPLDTPSRDAKTNEDAVKQCSVIWTVEHLQPGRGGPSPVNARESTICEWNLRPRTIPVVGEP